MTKNKIAAATITFQSSKRDNHTIKILPLKYNAMGRLCKGLV